MSRPTRAYFNPEALRHNLNRVKQCAPKQQIIAMVKANAYGCRLDNVIPVLDGQVAAFGVASIEEAMTVRQLRAQTGCVLVQGVFHPDEYQVAVELGMQCVIHHQQQLEWLLAIPLRQALKIWIKIDTGMHRLGFSPQEVPSILAAVRDCGWVSPDIGLMTHFASADEKNAASNASQLAQFEAIRDDGVRLIRSLANSAAILSMPETHADVVRPGIMLYGVSPFAHLTGAELGLKPVMKLISNITVIRHYSENAPIGYGGTWVSNKPSIIGVVPVGYGDGYPRHISEQTPTWVNGSIAPIVGRVSMDILTIDLTACPDVKVGDEVELWGEHIPVEDIARSAETIAYELITKTTSRIWDARSGYK